MITITKGQNPIENQELVVTSPSGEYEETEMIACAYVGTEESICSFEAKYIVLGNAVYR